MVAAFLAKLVAAITWERVREQERDKTNPGAEQRDFPLTGRGTNGRHGTRQETKAVERSQPWSRFPPSPGRRAAAGLFALRTSSLSSPSSKLAFALVLLPRFFPRERFSWPDARKRQLYRRGHGSREEWGEASSARHWRDEKCCARAHPANFLPRAIDPECTLLYLCCHHPRTAARNPEGNIPKASSTTTVLSLFALLCVLCLRLRCSIITLILLSPFLLLGLIPFCRYGDGLYGYEKSYYGVCC